MKSSTAGELVIFSEEAEINLGAKSKSRQSENFG